MFVALGGGRERRFWAALFVKKWPPKMCQKSLCRKKRCKINVFEPCFGPFLAHRFWGWVFLRCGARFWGPITRGRCHFRTSSSGTMTALFLFWYILPPVPRILRRKNPLSLRFHEVFWGHVATRGKILPRQQPIPWKLLKEMFLWLRGVVAL